MAIGNGYKYVLQTMRYKFVIMICKIICLRIFGSVKCGDRILMGHARKLKFSFYVHLPSIVLNKIFQYRYA